MTSICEYNKCNYIFPRTNILLILNPHIACKKNIYLRIICDIYQETGWIYRAPFKLLCNFSKIFAIQVLYK